MSYEARGDSLHCPRHNVTFGQLEQCGGCEGDPGDELAVDERPPPNKQALADARWCRTRRDAIVRLATELSRPIRPKKPKPRRSAPFVVEDHTVVAIEEERPFTALQLAVLRRARLSTAAKLYEVALKYHRVAIEERRSGDDLEHDRWLVEQARKLAGVGASH